MKVLEGESEVVRVVEELRRWWLERQESSSSLSCLFFKWEAQLLFESTEQAP